MDPTDHDKKDLGNGPSGGHGSTHANGGPPGDDGWLLSALENSSEVVKVVDADGILRYASPAFGRVFGYDPEETVGDMNVLDFVHPDDLPRVLAESERALSEGRTVSNRAEYRFRHADGSWRWVESVGTYLLEDPDVGGVVVRVRDISWRKEAEEVLRRSEAEIFSVLESITDGFFVLDEELRFAYVNTQAALMMERTREDLVGERLWEDPTFYPRYRRALGEAKTVTFEEYYPPLERWYSVRAYPSGTGLMVYFQDVTERKDAEEKLREAEERYRTLVEKVPPIIYIQTPREGETAAYDTTYISPRVEEVFGYPPQMFTEEPGFWDDLIHPEDLGAVREEDERTDETGEPFSMEYRVIANDGRTVWIRDEATLVRDGGGEPLYWLGVQTDVTERKEAEDRYRTLVERVPVAIYRQEVHHDGAVTYISPQIEAITGHAPEDYLADPTFWVRTMHPDDRQRVLDEDERTDRTGEPFKVEFRKITRDGRVIWLRDEAALVRDEADEPLYWQGVVSDITERKALEERLEYQVLHDPLTGLPNRLLFVDRLGHALDRTRRRRGLKAAVLFMDLDNFKGVNDSLGHDVGDLLLTVVAQRLGRSLRPEDVLARFGGDEFVVLLEEVEDAEEAVRVAERISKGFRSPFRLDGRELYASASIGIATGDARAKSPEDLLRDADTAMYRAKEVGGTYCVFDPAMHERAVKRLEEENDLRRAIERGEFVVHYQPIVRLDDRSVWGVEALVRWDHPERGLLNPDEFVPVAEESGLVVPMGEAVLEEACRRAKGWQEAYPKIPPLVVCVNLSARQLARPDLAETVEGALRRTGLEGNCLTLDVTETVYVRALEGNTAALDRLRALGVGISIDDFGTGYSSLSYLKRLPADALKIDKSFVGGLGKDAEDTAIVRTVVELAHTFGMEAIAEGVETEEQAILLIEMGCDKAQGYRFFRPLPPEDVPGFLGW